MKKLLGLLLIGSLLLSAPLAEAASAIATTTLNYRTGPGKNYPLMGSIAAGQPINVSACSGSWCQINFSGRGGWASSRYLAFNTGREVYQNYQRPSPSYNIIIGSGYYGGRHWDRRRYHSHPRPHWGGGYRPHYRPHGGGRPNHFSRPNYFGGRPNHHIRPGGMSRGGMQHGGPRLGNRGGGNFFDPRR